MGKSKQQKKFDKSEISSPILSEDIIKAIHTPPKERQGGFRALFADSNSQDHDDALLTSHSHVPSYIGLSCAISGYANYSPYPKTSGRSGTNSPASKRDTTTIDEAQSVTKQHNNTMTLSSPTHDIGSIGRSSSPTADTYKAKQFTVTKHSNLHNGNGRNESLSVQDRATRSPSPTALGHTEDDRHHGTITQARYCLLPPPNKQPTRHIPLLGIDDDMDESQLEKEENEDKSLQSRIASIYGEQFARETMTAKQRKELASTISSKKEEALNDQTSSGKNNNKSTTRSLLDRIKLKHVDTPKEPKPTANEKVAPEVDVNIDDAPVLAAVEKNFLQRLLTGGIPKILPKSSGSPKRTASPVMLPAEKSSETQQNTNSQPEASMVPTIEKSELRKDLEADSKLESRAVASELLPGKITTSEKTILPPSSSPEHAPLQVETAPNASESSSVSATHDRIDSPAEESNTVTNLVDLIDEPKSVHGQIQATLQSKTGNVDRTSNEAQFLDLSQTVEPVQSNETHDATISLISPTIETSTVSLDIKDEIVHEPVNVSAPVSEESTNVTSDSDRDGREFLQKVETESKKILDNMSKAEAILNDETEAQELDDDTIGKIHSAIGKANLLVNKKFKQFKKLCDENLKAKDQNEKFATLNGDLEGFWDLISIQINDVNEAFNALWKARANNWQFEENSENMPELTLVSNTIIPSLAKSSGRTKGNISKSNKSKLNAQKDQERRNRLQEHINQMKQKEAASAQQNDELNEDQLISITTSMEPQESRPPVSLMD